MANKFIVLLIFGLSVSSGFAVTETLTDAEYEAVRRMRANGGVDSSSVGGANGCFNSMLQSTQQSVQANLQARQNEVNGLMGISEKYLEMEQQCGNDLAEIRMEQDKARMEHEDKLLELPYLIEDQKLEYRESLLALQQECESSSGAAFQEWKTMVGTGVVTPERGGPMALFSRGRNINSYQKIFEMDCLGSKSNVERSHILAQRLANNIAKLQNSVDRSAQKVASLSKTLSFKQGVVIDNCMRAEAQLDYQAELTRQMASATNSATKTQNFLGMLGAVSTCIEGVGNSIDVTGSGTGTDARN